MQVGAIPESGDTIALAPQEHVAARAVANDRDPAPDNDSPLTIVEILEIHPELADITMSTTLWARARSCGFGVEANSISKYGYTLYYRNCNSVATTP